MLRKKTILYSLPACLAIMLFAMSCEKDKGPVLIVPPTPVDTLVHYESQIQPIFDANCITCHNEFHPYLSLMDGFSRDQLLFTGYNAPYVDTLNPPHSELIRHLTGELYLMPPNTPPLKQHVIDRITKWIEQGVRDN